jgi:hemolysin III
MSTTTLCRRSPRIRKPRKERFFETTRDRLVAALEGTGSNDYADARELVQHSAWRRSAADELVNALTHGLGLVLAVLGGLVMVVSVMAHGDPWRIAGCGVFVASLVAVYTASTLSHSATSVRWKSFFRRLDQGFIYLLIVGTYTPFGLAYWRTTAGWLLLAALWTVAILGFFSKIVLGHRVHSISMWSYIALGWLPVLAVPSLVQSVPLVIGGWMLVGGLCYTLGTLFLVFDARVRHFHAVWHVLVILGSACHFLGIFSAVANAAN